MRGGGRTIKGELIVVEIREGRVVAFLSRSIVELGQEAIILPHIEVLPNIVITLKMFLFKQDYLLISSYCCRC